MRLDPKLRYGAEMAARKQRRTLSSLIEWAVEQSLRRFRIREGNAQVDDETLIDALEKVWDVDPRDRLARLALHFPDLLTFEEQVLWKLVKENGFLWKGSWDSSGNWVWKVSPENLDFERLRERWDLFDAVAKGEKSPSVLPAWVKQRKADGDESKKNAPPPKNEYLEDDIPF